MLTRLLAVMLEKLAYALDHILSKWTKVRDLEQSQPDMEEIKESTEMMS